MKVRLNLIIHTCLLLLLATGCRDQTITENPPQTEMSGRLEAALAMEEGTFRHNTLCKVATDAAAAGDVDTVLRAIAEVDAGTAHDNLCSQCSEALARQGKASEATKVARRIANETSRNNLLSRIASGFDKP